MNHRSIFVGLCLVVFTVILEVELTPIVTLPPESVPTTATTENKQILTTSSEALVGSVVRLNVTVIPEEEDGLPEVEGVNATTVGRLDTNDTTTILPVIIEVTGNNSSNETVVQPVALSTTEIANQTAKEEEPTAPELILNTTTSTASTPYIEVTQFSVTSNPITLKSGGTTVQVDKLLEATSSTVVPVENQTANVTTTTINPPVRVTSMSGNVSNETEGDYKSKAPPEYHPYIEEILRADATQDNDTTTQVAPIRIKSKGYHSSHNDVNEHPYGPLPKFAEKEMNKLRLNHWRVHQILKGDAHQDSKLGRPATGTLKKDNNLQGKHQQHLSNFLGQKRASSAATAAVPAMKSSMDQDEFHFSILASEHDATAVMHTEEPTKLRSFFNWISSPLKKVKSGSSDEEDERLKQARKQEPILPFALGYRGDFLFW